MDATVDAAEASLILQRLYVTSQEEGAMLRYIRMAAMSLLVTLIPTAASAVGPCASRSELIAILKDNLGEIKAGHGLSNRGHLVEVFVSPAGSWTILLSQPNGLSCIVDAGEGWAMVPAAAKSREALQLPHLAVPGQVPARRVRLRQPHSSTAGL